MAINVTIEVICDRCETADATTITDVMETPDVDVDEAINDLGWRWAGACDETLLCPKCAGVDPRRLSGDKANPGR